MKALTLWQPWATLVAIGAKKIETRSWGTSYRGPLAIHAAKTFPGEAQDMCLQRFFAQALDDAGYGWPEQLPRGVIVAACRLVQVVEITEANAAGLSDQERAFGDYAPGRFAWILADVERLDEPIPARGRQGLWEWCR